MPDWLIERGIGESRTVRIVDGEIAEARILLDGIEQARTRLAARLKATRPRAIAEAQGQEYLLPKGAPGVPEGAELVIEVTREAIPGTEPWKRPLARVTAEAAGAEPTIDAEVIPFPTADGQLAKSGWDDVIDEARSGMVRFSGGELRISPTPAMSLIDVDGYLPPRELALTGATAAAKGHSPARHRRVDRGRSADRRRQVRSPGDRRGDRRNPAAAVRAHRGQWLRLRPDRPPPLARVAGRACAGSSILRSARAAAPNRPGKPRTEVPRGPSGRDPAPPAQASVARSARPPDRRHRRLARRCCSPHFHRTCRKPLIRRRNARCAGNRSRPHMRRSAAPHARIAISLSGSATATALPARRPTPKGWTVGRPAIRGAVRREGPAFADARPGSSVGRARD